MAKWNGSIVGGEADQQRKDAVREASRDAIIGGTGYVRITVDDDYVFWAERIDPETVRVK